MSGRPGTRPRSSAVGPSAARRERRSSSRTLPRRRCAVTWKSVAGSRTGSGRSTSVLRMLKIAVLAPIPRASDSTAVAANAGVRRKPRSAVAKILSQPFPPCPQGHLPDVFHHVAPDCRRLSAPRGAPPRATARRACTPPSPPRCETRIGIELIVERTSGERAIGRRPRDVEPAHHRQLLSAS